MNPLLKETKFNARAGKHTFVVRTYKSKQGNLTRYFMRCNGKIYLLKSDGTWMKVTCYNESLQRWSQRIFGVKVGKRGELK